ncbi:MBL fold metallo-hydrolase, partial [Glutamicibacter soli]|nr:MBL fold metallo-hydrolase [Glutamicibacter soli]
GREWAVHMGDGHAPEHATFWSLDDDLVLGGDQLLPSISPNLGVYPTEPDADPVGEWLRSCRRFAELAQPRHLVLPGHKLPFTGLPDRLGQLIENHTSALD